MASQAAATSRSMRAVVALLAAALTPSCATPWPAHGAAGAGALDGPGVWPLWALWAEGGAAVAAAGGAGSGPVLAPAFTANFVTDNPAFKDFSQGYGTYEYDSTKQRYRMRQCSRMDLFKPGQLLCMEQLAVNNSASGYSMNITSGTGADAVCKAMPAPYTDPFQSLWGSSHVGSGSVAGEPCELWAGVLMKPGYQVNVSACIAADGVPRQLNQTSNLAYKAMSDSIMTFSNVSVGPPPEEAFQPSEACRTRWPMPPCQQSSVQKVMLYRVRSAKEPNSLENRNLGDALGDMAFFCDISMDESQFVSAWSVEANSSWGQYAYCLYAGGKNSCFSGTAKHVGRMSALGLGKGHGQGQCSVNDDVGSWFSMPKEGHCPDGAHVGEGGCTWRAALQRTVSARCILEDRGLKAMCAKEHGHAPMIRSAAIFRRAFESADPLQGGCPDVEEEVTVLV